MNAKNACVHISQETATITKIDEYNQAKYSFVFK